MDNIIIYQDDICLGARSREKLKSKTEQVLRRLKQALKKALTRKPVIKIFDPKKEVTLTTDTSEHAIATVVYQEGHQIMYLSRKL